MIFRNNNEDMGDKDPDEKRRVPKPIKKRASKIIEEKKKPEIRRVVAKELPFKSEHYF